MKNQLSEEERTKYENGLKFTELIRNKMFYARILFMLGINLILGFFHITKNPLIPIVSTFVLMILFYNFDLPVQLKLVYSLDTVFMYVFVEILLYYLFIYRNIEYMRIIAICVNVYFCTTTSTKVDMSRKYCKEMLKK